MDADLVVFDPNAVIDNATYEDPSQPPGGIRWVVVNGAVAAEDGKIAGATTGKVLRRGEQ
jgi:N-acyl-D-aspartate/D-glutamate deacylase